MEFTGSSKTVKGAAQVLQCREQEVAKNFVFYVRQTTNSNCYNG